MLLAAELCRVLLPALCLAVDSTGPGHVAGGHNGSASMLSVFILTPKMICSAGIDAGSVFDPDPANS